MTPILDPTLSLKISKKHQWTHKPQGIYYTIFPVTNALDSQINPIYLLCIQLRSEIPADYDFKSQTVQICLK